MEDFDFVKEKVTKFIVENKYRILLASILAFVELFLFVYPVEWGYYYKKLLVIIIFFTWLGGFVRISQKYQWICGVLLLLVTPPIMIQWLEEIALKITDISEKAILYNILLAYIIEMVILLFSLSIRFSVGASAVGLTIIYTINYFVYVFRGRDFSINDILGLETAVKVMGNYDFTPTNIMVVAWSWMLLLIVWARGIKPTFVKMAEKRKRLAFRLGGILLGAVVLIVSGKIFVNVQFWEDRGLIVENGFSGLFYCDGYLVSSCLEWAYGGVKKPENYSTENAETILAEYTANTQTEELPHIILIMNESMSDLRVWGELELSDECMPFFDSLSENTVRGYVNASVLGGGTANSEFEVLFGASMGLLPSAYYPYQQCIEPDMVSMVSMLEEQGYASYSIHPENRKNWNREKVYEYMGFDTSFWLEDFEGAQVVNSGVADFETYNKIIELYEEREKDTPLFVFDVTMQNHGGYTWTQVEHDIRSNRLDDKDLNNYLSLLRTSDEDFEALIRYFAEVEEKVIICMFGDHQPKFINENTYDIICEETPDLSEGDRIMNLYKTPFVIWSNYDIEEQHDMNISMNYLGALLLETADVNASPYFEFLNTLREEYPVITVNGFCDNQDGFYFWKEENEQFQVYRMLQYYVLFDETYRREKE